MEYKAARRSLQGFPVQFAVLGFLTESPAHGYALRTRIAEGLGPLWQIASSQLYQVLHKLETQDWVSCRVGDPAGGPARKIYRLTDEGRAAFAAWANEPVLNIRDLRVELLAKLYFLRRHAPGNVASLIEQQLKILREVRGRVAGHEATIGDDTAIDQAWADLRCRTIDTCVEWLRRHAESFCTPKENG